MSNGLSLHKQILLGAALGCGIGLALQYSGLSHPLAHSIFSLAETLGTLFIAMLRMVVIPLIFTSIASGIAHLRKHSQMGRVWKFTLTYFLCTTTVAILTGLAIVNLLAPGKGLETPAFTNSSISLEYKQITLSSFAQNLASQLFLNPLAAMAGGKILPTVIFALLLGAALVKKGSDSTQTETLLKELFELIMTITHWIMRTAPLGIMGLCLTLVATQDLAIITQMALFVCIVIGATLAHGLITLPLILRFFTSIHPLRFFSSMQNAFITALSTSSSSATLPITIECVEKKLGVNKDVANFVLPIGATMNMDGTALYEAIAALFIANLVGIELSLSQQLVIFLMTTVAAIGAPGIPSAGMTTMIMVLESVGLPAEGIAILLPLDRLLDTIRTAVNIEGDAIGCCVIHSLLKES